MKIIRFELDSKQLKLKCLLLLLMSKNDLEDGANTMSY